MKPRTPAKKYHFMLGTTSRVPGAPGWHYLLIDLDKPELPAQMPLLGIMQRTQSGWHIYTPYRMRLDEMVRTSRQIFGADRTWARLALKRGWAFLADKDEVKIPWPVERMVIGWRTNAR